MLRRSISRTDAAPSAQASAFSRILTARRLRSAAVSILESSTPRIARMSGGMITAHATTGPASGPRPTSSTPASRGPRSLRRSLSMLVQRFRRYGARPLGEDSFEPLSVALPAPTVRMLAALLPAVADGVPYASVPGVGTRTFLSLMRVALPVRWRR